MVPHLNLKDNWIDQLSITGFFDSVPDRGARSDIKTEHQQQQQQLAHDNFLATNNSETRQQRKRLLALRGNDLLLAVGSQIRVLSLYEFKSTWVAAMEQQLAGIGLDDADYSLLLDHPYKVFESQDIDFDINEIIPNTSGTLLAVTGDHRLVVVCWPRKSFSDQVNIPMDAIYHQTTACETFPIGQDFYGDNFQVQKVTWHPLSQNDSHLTVLSNDSVLCIFDVGENVCEPEQVFDLASSHRRRTKAPHQSTITADDNMDEYEEVASFFLGGTSQDTSRWEPFTIYYALKNGHVYALCPVLPYKSVVRKKHLESLACVVKTYKMLNDGDNYTDPSPYFYYFTQQLYWIQDMWKFSNKYSCATMDDNDICIRINKTTIPLKVQPQGPFVIDHEIEQQFFGNTMVNDMLLLRINRLNLLILAFTNGSIHHYLLDHEIDAQWIPLSDNLPGKELNKLQSSVDFLPRASHYETIYLGNSLTWLLIDSVLIDTYYAYHAGGLYAISTKNLADYLSCMKKELQMSGGSNVLLASCNQNDAVSRLKCIINLCAFESPLITQMLGAVATDDIFLRHCLLLLDSNYRMLGVDMEFEGTIGFPTSFSEQSLPDSNHSLSRPWYHLHLPQPTFNSLSTLQELASQHYWSKMVLSLEHGDGKDAVFMKESLEFLGVTYDHISKCYREIALPTLLMGDWLTAQKQEYDHQITTAIELHQRAFVLIPNMHSKLAAGIKSTQKIHKHISTRIDRILYTIANAQQLILSDKEKKWIEKMYSMESKINVYSQQIKNLGDQLAYLNDMEKQLKTSHVSSKPKYSLSFQEASSILNTLNIQKLSITDAKTKVEKLNQINGG